MRLCRRIGSTLIEAVRLAESDLVEKLTTRFSTSPGDLQAGVRGEARFLGTTEASRRALLDEWTATVQARSDGFDPAAWYGQEAIAEMLATGLFCFDREVPQSFLAFWGHSRLQFATVVKTDYDPITWRNLIPSEPLGDGCAARARVLLAQLTRLSERGMVEDFPMHRCVGKIETHIYNAACCVPG